MPRRHRYGWKSQGPPTAHGPGKRKNLLADGSMDAPGVTSWIAGFGATLTKQANAAHGAQCLRIAYNGTNYPYATQNVLSIGGVFVVQGWARGDGTYAPQMWDSGTSLMWTGTVSTAWQRFNFLWTGVGAQPRMHSLATGAGYCEVDEWVIYRVG